MSNMIKQNKIDEKLEETKKNKGNKTIWNEKYKLWNF